MTQEIREVFFPFNSVTDENGKPDRQYDAEDFANYWNKFIGNGIYPNPSNNLKVESLNDNMVVTLNPGASFLTGYGHNLKDPMSLTVAGSHPAYMRKDAIVVRLNLTDRYAKALYIEGVAAASPLVPELKRTADIFDLRLAVITVRAGTQKILTSDVLDTRLDSTVCGVVQGVVEQVDTTEIFDQYQAYLDAQINYWNTTKAQQVTDWQTQMTQQADDWSEAADSRTTAWDGWFNGAKADITTLQSFNFDNWLELPGTTYSESKNPTTGAWTTVITLGSRKIAERIDNPKNEQGEFLATINVYKEDGSIKKTATAKEYKNADGVWIKEVR